MPNYHVTIHGADREAMADLVRAHHVRVYGQTLTCSAWPPCGEHWTRP